MKTSIKTKRFLPLIIILALGLFSACNNYSPATSPPGEPVNPPATVTPSSEKTPDTVDKIELVYFHSPQRCKTCICFEKRISSVVETYFQEELKNGKLTWEICDLGDNKNTAVINKYRAVGPQLFVNTIKDGVDDIRDIQEIWSWGCLNNDDGFDNSVRAVIELSLRGES